MKTFRVVALATLMFPSALWAQVYGSASLGASRNEIDCSGLPRCDKSGTAFKVTAGYRITPLFAAELAYFDFGKSKNGDATFTQEFASSGIGAGFALHGAFAENWSWVARLGAARLEATLRVTGAPGSVADTRARPYLGLGIGYRLSDRWTLDLTWDAGRTEFRPDRPEGRSWDSHALSLGITWHR